MDWKPTIGLEIHAELKTQTKMFCVSRNDPKETRPNVNICPVCMAHPGTLPVINKEAVRHVLMVGSAVGGEIADYTEFDRKNYFYPDIPKGYQISQYAFPLIKGGTLAGVQLTRIHLEEDTARSSHEGGETHIDYNRAGVPLMELVTEPVIHDAVTAGTFAKELQLLLRYLNASDANMEEGQMRVEANISVSKDEKFGTKVEVKNLNSFRSVERAIAYEIQRQIALLEEGGSVVQETRGFDEVKGVTFSQRKKESSHDYRYFPDPDLPKLNLSSIKEFAPDALADALPELPWERRTRYVSLGLSKEDTEMIVREMHFSTFIDASVEDSPSLVQRAVHYLTSDIAGLLESGKMDRSWVEDPANSIRFRELMQLLEEGKLSSRAAKNILELMIADTRHPEDIATAEGLFQKSDRGSLEEMARTILANNPTVVDDYKAGKASSIQFFVGQGMKESKGAANPEVLREVFERLLS